jgi:hypothetical protein
MARIGNYTKPKFITHTITASENSSGVVRLPVLNTVVSSGTDLNFLYQIRTSVGTDKTAASKAKYVKSSGVLNVFEGTTTYETGDILMVHCSFAK